MRIIAATFIVCLAGWASAQETNLIISAEGKPVLELRVPSTAEITTKENHTKIRTPDMSLHLWVLADAKTPADALEKVADVIKGEFVKFKATNTTEVVIAGAAGKEVSGSGVEADDGDPGSASTVFFSMGGHVFAGCVHGEFDYAARTRKHMLTVLQTAKAPGQHVK